MGTWLCLLQEGQRMDEQRERGDPLDPRCLGEGLGRRWGVRVLVCLGKERIS